jgi:hypothetical protein
MLLLVSGLSGGTSEAAAQAAPNVAWTELLPPHSSPAQAERAPVARCRQARLRCVTVQIRRMKRLRDRLGCDHRAVFATTYLTLTRVARRTVGRNPRFFRQPRFFFREVALFANVYFRTIRAWNRGRPVPAAWRIAFQAARSPHVNGGQDMLLGINAHVQQDMPFVLAALSLRSPRGASRKRDHDRMNRVLKRAYEPVVREVERRYDPIMGALNEPWSPLDDIAGLEMVKAWREVVWRNAERLVNAASEAERSRVADEIEAHAAAWAMTLAVPIQRDYGPRRDAYCRARLGA